MSGPNSCAYTAMPSSTWNGQVICTQGASASASAPSVAPPPPVTSGQIIYTESIQATSGSGTIVYGCTATSIEYGVDPYPFTVCVGSTTPLTTVFPAISTTTTTSAIASSTASAALSPFFLFCHDSAWYLSKAACLSGCLGGYCSAYEEKMVKERCVDCGGRFPVSKQWQCACVS